jgi:hypothetical protein
VGRATAARHGRRTAYRIDRIHRMDGDGGALHDEVQLR